MIFATSAFKPQEKLKVKQSNRVIKTEINYSRCAQFHFFEKRNKNRTRKLKNKKNVFVKRK